MMAAASSSTPAGTRSAGFAGGDGTAAGGGAIDGAGGDGSAGDEAAGFGDVCCGACSAGDGRASVLRSSFASCSLRRVSCSSAFTICSWACASLSSAPPVEGSRGVSSEGVEFIGASISPSNAFHVVAGHPPAQGPFLSKEWLHDGRILNRNAMTQKQPAGRTACSPDLLAAR